ncbi:MAG: hypothetical protein OJF49_000494 [Ktedonobacterales bacterium]|nr:MAG: hypothetical protein OJF49_000494 [Ktedonobacterales bacterium]
MRVMIFSDTYPPQVNGVATCVETLARSLARDGHTVMVCTAGGHRSRAGGDEPFAVVRLRAVPLPLYSDFTLASPVGITLMRLVARFRPDVIHCHTPFSIGWQGARAAKLHGIPLIGTHHTLFGEYVDAYSRFGHQVNQRISALIRRYVATFYNQCDLISCASHYLVRDVIAGGLHRPAIIVPNPVDTGRFHPIARSKNRSKRSAVKMLYFGRLAAEKNLPHLLDLTEPVLRRNPNAVFNIAGDGPMMGHLKAQAQGMGLDGRIRFLGWMRGDALAKQVAGSDICVSASLTENQPMALLESLACGVPVVALAAAGVPEIIEDGYNGFLASPDDTTGVFARSLERLVREPKLRLEMSASAYESAQAYSHEACLRATLCSYEQTMELAGEARSQRRGLRLPNPRVLARHIPRLRW